MRRFITTLIALTFVVLSFGQDKQSRVTLKNGVTVTGSIKEFNPASHITLVIAGFETRIEMSDISTIEEAKIDSTTPISSGGKGKEREIQPISDGTYPESYTIEVGPFSIEMVLIPGAFFQMGYDGHGSLKMRSEPIHDVIVHSYYVNKEPLSKELVKYLRTKKVRDIKKDGPYSPTSWYEAYTATKKLAENTGLPIDLITEAQWEYLMTTSNKDRLSILKDESNYCPDYLRDYEESEEPVVDPVQENPSASVFFRVQRSIKGEKSAVYARYDDNSFLGGQPAIRISFPASALK